MDATSPLTFRTYGLERQRRVGGRFHGDGCTLTLMEGQARFAAAVERALWRFNQSDTQIRLVDSLGNVVECVDLVAVRRKRRAEAMREAGGLDGVLERELEKHARG